MNFDLADLRAFLAVADLGSFRAAAGSLHLSQSAVSRRVDKLEEALGVDLFVRTTRSVELTAIGRTFVHKARGVMNELEGALLGIADSAQRISGEVTVACVPSAVGYFLPAVIGRFHQLHARIRVRLIDESSADILLAVANGEADLGLTYIGTQEPDIEFEPLLEDPFVVACPRDHALANKRRVTWAELAKHDYVSLAQGSGNRFLLDQALGPLARKPEWFCEVRHVPALVSLVEAGLGIGVVPRLAMPPRGRLASIALEEPSLSRTIGIIRRRGRALRPAAESFRRLLLQLASPPRARRASRPAAS
ncbi:LysR family transcriptional regulator [Ramlibacter tataouinensis]|nr:LysR family transcriptional regulator [Ramlibacter tataouinensis]